MPPRGAFSPKRKAFLESKRAEFAVAVENNHTADTLATIFRQFFKRFPIDLDDDEEPTDEALAAIDDNAPDPEIKEPSESMGVEAYEAALDASKARQIRVQAKRGQISRWFTYRYLKDRNVDPHSNDPKNPYNVLLLQLSGNLLAAKPRRKSPVNIWIHDKTSTQPVKNKVTHILGGQKGEPRKMVAIRAEAAHIAFQNLPAVEQERWKVAADEEYEKALRQYTEICKGAVSTRPEDRQRAINGLVRFVQPILDRVASVTGFNVSLFAGGPEPARQGRLSLISMHSGTTGGDVPLNFGQAERAAYKQYIMPIWARFMWACFTPEECRRRALVSSSVEDSLQSVAMDQEGSSFDSFDLPEPSSGTSISKPNSPPTDASVSHLSTPARNASNTESPPSGIAGLTEAIRNISHRIEQSVARSIAGSISPTASLVPSPLPSAAPSPVSAAAKRGRSGSTINASNKKHRASRATSSPCVAPPDAPAWVSSAIDMLASEPLGDKWEVLVAAWLVYEGARNFEGNKLSPKGRPKVVADWIKWARKPTWRPSNFPKLDEFGCQHILWWKTLQPKWRAVDNEVHGSEGEEGKWDCLHVGGVNGLLSALASLFFWGLAIRDSDGNTDSWEGVVEDTLFVIQQLTNNLK